jgi:hypothetical protein
MKAALIDSSGIVQNTVVWDSNCAAPTGLTAITLDDSVNASIGWVYSNGTFIAPASPAPSLAQAQATQAAIIKAACQAQIVSGFTSLALGSAHTYPSQMTDQQNLTASVLASLLPNLAAGWTTPFWCQNSSGTWAQVQHTAAQIQQVGLDGKTAVTNAITKSADLQAQIQAATSVAQVQAIVW